MSVATVTSQASEIGQIISENLTWAETCWEAVGLLLEIHLRENRNFTKSAQPSRIPGHPLVEEGIPKVDDFIAMVVDMRDSSKHLLQAISKDRAKVSELQRVFYETSALLPATAKAISDEKGNVTEYLGDGVLALFQVSKESPSLAIYSALGAARNCIGLVRELINHELYNRYTLPPIDLGVGLSMSRAMVTLVGENENPQPKVIGECVYRATKLSKGRNEIIVDEVLYNIWPTSNNGKLRFSSKQLHNVNGYVISSDTK